MDDVPIDRLYCAGGEEQYCENGFIGTCYNLLFTNAPRAHLTNTTTLRPWAFDTPGHRARNVGLLANRDT